MATTIIRHRRQHHQHHTPTATRPFFALRIELQVHHCLFSPRSNDTFNRLYKLGLKSLLTKPQTTRKNLAGLQEKFRPRYTRPFDPALSIMPLASSLSWMSCSTVPRHDGGSEADDPDTRSLPSSSSRIVGTVTPRRTLYNGTRHGKPRRLGRFPTGWADTSAVSGRELN
jgi:hypothetical protein